MGMERNRASWISVARVARRPGVSAERRSALPRCSCPYAGTTRIRFEGLPRLGTKPAASQPPVGAPLGRHDYPQSIGPSSRLCRTSQTQSGHDGLALFRIAMTLATRSGLTVGSTSTRICSQPSNKGGSHPPPRGPDPALIRTGRLARARFAFNAQSSFSRGLGLPRSGYKLQ